MTDGENDPMVDAVYAIEDPVQRVIEAERLRAANDRRRGQIARLRMEAQQALQAHRDDAHPDGWSLADIAELIGRHRGTVGNVVKGRDLAAVLREIDDPDAE